MAVERVAYFCVDRHRLSAPPPSSLPCSSVQHVKLHMMPGTPTPPVVLSRLSCPCCHVLAVLSSYFLSKMYYPDKFFSCSIPAVMSRLSCPGFPLPKVVCLLSSPSCPFPGTHVPSSTGPAILSLPSCPNCPAIFVTFSEFLCKKQIKISPKIWKGKFLLP